MIERHEWHGQIEVIVREHRGRVPRIIARATFPNLIVTAGKNMMRDVLRGAVTNGSIAYVALGSSSTAPAAADTQLGSEQFRKALTTTPTMPGAGQVLTTVYIAPGEANSFTIQEIGWFAGTSATGTANTGILVAHVLYTLAKTSSQSLQINRTDSF